MDLEKNKVIERIKEAKSYGLPYSHLAREIGLQPMTIYLFINGTYNLSKQKQIQVLCYIENYIAEIKGQLKTIERKEVYVK